MDDNNSLVVVWMNEVEVALNRIRRICEAPPFPMGKGCKHAKHNLATSSIVSTHLLSSLLFFLFFYI